MGKIINKIVNAAVNIGTKFVGGVSQKETEAALGGVAVAPGAPEILRRAASEGAVLLKNAGELPYTNKNTVSVFSRTQIDWFFTGYGSGGDVKKPYGVSLIDALKNRDDVKINENLAKIYADWTEKNPAYRGFWGRWPRSFPDMPLDDATVKKSSEESDRALYIIGRSTGEDMDDSLEKGGYYPTDGERKALDLITKYFKSVTVLLNVGTIIDASWIEEYGDKIGAVLLVWQGGMESGNAVADLLCGKTNPCGKLADTIAARYEDYPSSANFGNKAYNEYREDIYVGYRYFETFNKGAVLYPFGFGLSYTDFNITFGGADKADGGVLLGCAVKNVGNVAGREVAQVYLSKPVGVLGNPSRELVGFKKTKKLSPGESETLEIFIPEEFFYSYDDDGKTGYPYSYVVEKGEFSLYLGGDVRSAEKVWSRFNEKTRQMKKLKQVCAPPKAFPRFVNVGGELKKEKVGTAKYDLKKIILTNLPDGTPITGDKGYKLKDVKEDKIALDEFVSQLEPDELEAISRGDYTMNSPLGPLGNAGVFGGVTESLRKKGVPPIVTTDGPSGIRLSSYCSLIPIGTLLACSFDVELVKEVYASVASEMKEKGSDVLLAPGMNVHRNPLCGRNFEYFSEDPVLTGRTAAAAVEGAQSLGGSACPKHFACNNQERNRLYNDARVSERALREIYLKGFEICIKQSKPKCLMTSYNRTNGVWSHYNYELCERILREEWGYEGLVMTDWWMRYKRSPEFPKIRDNGYRVRASADVLMPGGKRVGPRKPDGTLLKTYGEPEGITLGELQRTAKRALKLCIEYLD